MVLYTAAALRVTSLGHFAILFFYIVDVLVMTQSDGKYNNNILL